MTSLPEAVLTHLDVLGVEADGATVASKLLPDDGGWQRYPANEEPALTQELIEHLSREGVRALEIRLPGTWVAEFQMSELVR